MKMRGILVLVVVIFVAAGFPASAQSASDGAPEGPGFSFGLGIGIGTNSFPSYQPSPAPKSYTFQTLMLAPELVLGKFAIGLDFKLNFSTTGGTDGDEFEVREEDWVVGDFQEFLDVYLPKIRYIRYGLKGDPIFAKFGTIEDATLGNGFIMAGYSNALFLPETRIFGLSLDVDGKLFNFPYVGFESFAANLARFDVVGARLYTRPLAGSSLPLLTELQIGGTVAMDRDPRYFAELYENYPPALLPPTDAEVLVYGVDFRLPLLAGDLLSLAVFGDGVVQKEGSGAMTGFGGRLVRFISYGAQLRFMEDNFIPTYFGASYDLFRPDQYLVYDGTVEKKGGIGWFATLGFSALADTIVFTTSAAGPLGAIDGNYFSWQAFFEVKEGVVPGFFFDVLYDKQNMANFDDFRKWREEALIRARVNYRTGPAIISLVYNLRYDPAATGSDKWQVTSGIESRIALF